MEPKFKAHPRIHVTAEGFAELKKKAATTHSFYYGKLIEAADEISAQKLPRSFAGGDETRHFGDSLPVLAMAHILSGQSKYLDFAREILSRLVAADNWGDNLDLVTGHFLTGAAISYDWLYDRLRDDERKALAAKIVHHAEILYRYASGQRVWWHDYFLHNWNHVIIGSLAYAAAALHGEHPSAGAWSDYTGALFKDVEEALPEDGSYQEGFAYMTYAWECMVRYFDLARQLYGRNHYGAKWLREAPYLLLYFSAPYPRWHDNCMMFGDGPRHFEWHGPVHLLFRSADEYRDPVIQGFAKELAAAGVGLTHAGTWLNMLWYNPALEAAPHAALPTARLFQNLDVFSARSGWDRDAVMVGFKCTTNAGRKTVRDYPGRDLGSGHAHPDAASFQVYAFGQWLAVDTGYTHYKQSKDHNTVVVNGIQQLGGERIWYDMMECFSNGASAEITHCVTTPEYDYARGDASTIYRPQARLAKFVRHLIFLKPADVIVVDELEGQVKSSFEWRLHADDEIAGDGGCYTVRKGDARLAISFLAPEALKVKVARTRIPHASSAGMTEAVVLSATTPRARQTTIVAFMNAHRGDAPSSRASLAGIEDGVIKVRVESSSGARTLSLDTKNAAVTLSR